EVGDDVMIAVVMPSARPGSRRFEACDRRGEIALLDRGPIRRHVRGRYVLNSHSSSLILRPFLLLSEESPQRRSRGWTIGSDSASGSDSGSASTLAWPSRLGGQVILVSQ